MDLCQVSSRDDVFMVLVLSFCRAHALTLFFTSLSEGQLSPTRLTTLHTRSLKDAFEIHHNASL